MTRFDYARGAATAVRLLTRFGAALTLTATAGLGSTATRPVQGVFVQRVRHTLENSGVEIGDWKVLLDSAAAPALTERLTRGTGREQESFVVVYVEPIQPGDTVVAWWAWVRAG